MIDDETKEPQDTSDEGSEAEAAGPVAGEDSSSSQAAGEEPTPTPPADEASEASSEEPVAEGDAAEEPVAEEPIDEAPAADAEAADEPVAEQEEAQAEATSEPEVEKPAAEKKKDVIPGADLEPIAVETTERPLSAEEKARKEAEEEERAKREAELTGEAEEEPSAASRAPAKMEGDARYLATGKRKTSIARVTLLPGSGKVEINKRALEEFFPRPLHRTMALQPLAITGYEGSVDVRVRVHGGGISGQAGAVRHGIARALTEVDPELRGELKRRGFLTRDARAKERKKAGLKKARKRPQFSKR
ncbi:MAG: small subunit ribosomal protein [Solirubrobacterales bacterium]|nr:small subunit ribosomal protein [Solirubrobacterales bacterium]